jgi:hypothetical protein
MHRVHKQEPYMIIFFFISEMISIHGLAYADLNFRVCKEGCKLFAIFSKLIFFDDNLLKFIKEEEN